MGRPQGWEGPYDRNLKPWTTLLDPGTNRAETTCSPRDTEEQKSPEAPLQPGPEQCVPARQASYIGNMYKEPTLTCRAED